MGSPAMAADLTDLSWLAGTWVEKPSEHKTIEIHWSQPDGNSMVGTYRVTIDDKLLMYEILTIIADKDRITYRFDLFGKSSDFQNPATSNFRLTANSGTTAHFEGKFGGEGPLMLLTIERSSEDILTGWMVEASNPEGKRFVGYRAKLQK
jgi:hypothetical protein